MWGRNLIALKLIIIKNKRLIELKLIIKNKYRLVKALKDQKYRRINWNKINS